MEPQQQSQQPHILQNSVVVFSKNYLPLARINIKRAVVLLVTGQAESLELDFNSTKLWQVRSQAVVLQVPEHIRSYVGNPERHWKVPPVNRREVLRRDNHTCQYCGNTKHLTLDHVIPRSKGGQHTWENVVTACEKCNSTKSDVWRQAASRLRLPHEAGMVLKNKPKAPIHPGVAFAEQFWNTQRLNETE